MTTSVFFTLFHPNLTSTAIHLYFALPEVCSFAKKCTLNLFVFLQDQVLITFHC